ncbi:branched-chain amino acid ABC transporter permease [Nitratifractor sp.]
MRAFARRWNLRPSLGFLVLILALVPFTLENDFYYEIAILALFNAMIAVGLNLLMGYAGQISLAHGAFAGLGGYIAAILTGHYGLSPLFSIAVALGSMAILAYLLARPILRLHGHYLAMATLGVGIIISIVLNNEEELTGGTDGMSVESFSLFGHPFTESWEWYLLAALHLVALLWLAQNLIDSPLGRILRSLHDSEKAPASVGVRVARYKSLVFVLSVLVATLAGSLYAFFSGFISPQEAGFDRSIELVVMVVLGGMGRLYGAVVGAVILTLLPQLLTAFEDYQTLIYGAIIIGVMIFMPRGIVSLFDPIVERMKK